MSVAYAEDFAPHITISRSEKATLIINEVDKEEEGVYKFTVRFLTLGDRRISRNFSLEVRGKITVRDGTISLFDIIARKAHVRPLRDSHVFKFTLCSRMIADDFLILRKR